MELIISLGRHAADPTPNRIQTTWPEFVQWVYQHPRTQASLSPAEYAHLKQFPTKSAEGQRIHADKDGPYCVLADFGGQRRAYDSLRHSSGIPLDFDAGWITEDVIRATLVGHGLCYVAFTTYAHQPGAERWRVFIPSARPMTADEHTAAWTYLSALFGNAADPAAKDATRLSYLPGTCLLPDAARTFRADGQPFQPIPVAPAPPVTLQAQTGPVPGWAGPTDDTELLTIACNTRTRPDERFGGPIHFAMLWTANADWLHVRFPGANGQPWDYTQADMALAGELAYWTGRDAERMERLMKASGLAQARGADDDWLDRKVGLAVQRACENAKQFHFMRTVPAGTEAPEPPAYIPQITVGGISVALTVDGVPVAPDPPSMIAPTAAAAIMANAPVSMDDYFAYLPEHTYIHRPTGEQHPAATVDELIGKEARQILVPTRPVHRMTWAPGYPERFQVKTMDETDFKAADAWLYNRYQPPKPPTKAGDVKPWLDLIARLYPDDVDHIVNYMADAVQTPQHKCNHALVLGSGVHGIGKDTLLAPLRHAIGHRNYAIIKPSDLVDSTNPWVASVVVQISESRDMGDSGFTGITRYEMYERCKDLAAAPPATLLCNDKYIRKHQVLNVLRLVVTTNHMTDGLHMDPEDRRHYCAWSDADKMDEETSAAIWGWYNAGGLDNVAHYLATLDLTARGWNRAARPLQTAWWHQLVEGGRPAEDERFNDAVDKLAKPDWLTLSMIAGAGGLELAGWIAAPANRRKVEREMERAGYRRFPNPADNRGRWYVGGQRVAVYRRMNVRATDLLRLFNAQTAA